MIPLTVEMVFRNALEKLASASLIEGDLRLFNIIFTLNLGTLKPPGGNKSLVTH